MRPLVGELATWHSWPAGPCWSRWPTRWPGGTRAEDLAALNAVSGVEVMTRSDGALLALFPDKWRVQSVQRTHPDVVLEPLVAGDL